MAPSDHHGTFDASNVFADGNAPRQSSPDAPITVYNCSRLGLQANPPGRSFGWFRRR